MNRHFLASVVIAVIAVMAAILLWQVHPLATAGVLVAAAVIVFMLVQRGASGISEEMRYRMIMAAPPAHGYTEYETSEHPISAGTEPQAVEEPKREPGEQVVMPVQPPASPYIPSASQNGTTQTIAAVPQSETAASAPATFFTAYYARESLSNARQGLYVYAHLQDALTQIENDVQQFIEQLRGNVPRPASAQQSSRLAVGTALTIMPEADGLEFDPVAITRKWQPPYTRFDFHYRAPQQLVGEIVTGRIAVLVAGIEIAQIRFATKIEQGAQEIEPAQIPANPLAAAKLTHTEPSPTYDRIFISYSRKDNVVAENYRLAQIAAGNEVFMDTYSIRTGEDWRVALANAIDQADIFQLFWSENSANSENVRDEWDYALQFRCAQDRCAEFIRPVFWDDPMPQPPAELSHLNFRRVPFRTGE